MFTHYTSGDWHVRAGSEEEFVKRWTAFVDWAKENAHGHFYLIRENDDPGHFVSVGGFDSAEDRQHWVTAPEFQDAFKACGDLCDSFHGTAYTLVTSVG